MNMLKKKVAVWEKAQTVNVGNVLIMLLVSELILFLAIIPAVTEAISTAAFTGTLSTLADLVPLFLVLVGVLLPVAIIYFVMPRGA